MQKGSGAKVKVVAVAVPLKLYADMKQFASTRNIADSRAGAFLIELGVGIAKKKLGTLMLPWKGIN